MHLLLNTNWGVQDLVPMVEGTMTLYIIIVPPKVEKLIAESTRTGAVGVQAIMSHQRKHDNLGIGNLGSFPVALPSSACRATQVGSQEDSCNG